MSTIVMTRKINVRDSGGKNTTINTTAQTWGELQREMETMNISTNSKKAIIGETKNTMEVGGAVLPEGNFTLFLFPVKTKSGVSATRVEIKEIIAKEGAAAKEHFSADKSYTNKNEAELVDLLEKWKKGVAVPVKKKAADKKETKPATSKSVKKTEAPIEFPEFDNTSLKSIHDKLDIILSRIPERPSVSTAIVSDDVDSMEKSIKNEFSGLIR